MTFGLKDTESLLDGLRREVHYQADLAREMLVQSADVGTSAHEARRTLKRSRALLKFAQPVLTPPSFSLGNDTLRNAGRCMATVRDAGVLVETVSLVLGSREWGDLDAVWKGLIDELEGRRDGLFSTAMDPGGPFACAIDLLESFDVSWPRQDEVDERELLRVGLTASCQAFWDYRRRAFRAGGDEKIYHTLRKRAKDLRHQIEFLSPIASDELTSMASNLDQLGELLGEANDLVVLASYVGLGDALIEDQRARVLEGLRTRQAELWAQAKRVGESVLTGGVGRFVARVERYWVRSRPQG